MVRRHKFTFRHGEKMWMTETWKGNLWDKTDRRANKCFCEDSSWKKITVRKQIKKNKNKKNKETKARQDTVDSHHRGKENSVTTDCGVGEVGWGQGKHRVWRMCVCLSILISRSPCKSTPFVQFSPHLPGIFLHFTLKLLDLFCYQWTGQASGHTTALSPLDLEHLSPSSLLLYDKPLASASEKKIIPLFCYTGCLC